MKSTKVYKILYYISLIFTMILSLLFITLEDVLMISYGLGEINLILVGIFSLCLIKKKLQNINNLFPILYLLFLIIVMVLALIYNTKVIISYMHFDYFISFILLDYLLLNTYSLLSLKK